MIGQVDVNNKGYIGVRYLLYTLDFKDFLRAIAIYKIIEEENEEDDTCKYFIMIQLVDAFVAMGGNSDKTGTVDANKLI